MNKIILISDNEIDTDLFNNQIFLEDTQRSETLASPVPQIEVEAPKKEVPSLSLFVIIGALVLLILILVAFIVRISNKQTKSTSTNEKGNSYNNGEDEINIIEKRPRRKFKGQTYATPNSLNEAIRQFLNITKTK